MSGERKPLLFGCRWPDSGHGLYDGTGKSYGDPMSVGLPWGWKIDGGFAPKSAKEQGAAALHHLDGWTILAFRDYRTDSRPGSNSAVFLPGTLDFDAALAAATEAFPDPMRSNHGIHLAPTPTPTDQTKAGEPS